MARGAQRQCATKLQFYEARQGAKGRIGSATRMIGLRMCVNPKHLHDWASDEECLLPDLGERIQARIQRHIAEGPAREQLALQQACVDSVMRGHSGIIDRNSPAYGAWMDWMDRRAKARVHSGNVLRERHRDMSNATHDLA
jgi:hypothetical protein